MKTIKYAAAAAVLFVSAAAWAGFAATLKNEDSKPYKYELSCNGATTTSTIAPHTEETLRSSCKLKVEGAGTASLVDDMKCVIKNGSLSC